MYADLEDDTYIYLVMEYVTKSNLFALIKKENCFSEETAFYFFIQTVAGIYFLHKNGFIHRDLKPENILIMDDCLKLADFGSCRGIYSKQPYTEYISTRWYRAPELLLGQRLYSTGVDVWSLGCIMGELLCKTQLSCR